MAPGERPGAVAAGGGPPAAARRGLGDAPAAERACLPSGRCSGQKFWKALPPFGLEYTLGITGVRTQFLIHTEN